MNIEYKVGNLFEEINLVKDKTIYIPHVVNNIGAWGAGFTKDISYYYPSAKQDFKDWTSESLKFGFSYKLGNTSASFVAKNICIIHMCAQNGLPSKDNPQPLCYVSLEKCLRQVCSCLRYENDYEIHAPAFGTGLARGNWLWIKNIIEKVVIDYDLDNLKFVVYTLTSVQRDALFAQLRYTK